VTRIEIARILFIAGVAALFILVLGDVVKHVLIPASLEAR